jgi:glycerate kinase
LVLTGEGRLDQQSLSGKVVGSVVREAQRAGVPVRALVGAAGPGAEEVVAAGLGGYEDLVTLAGSVEAARADPERWLTLAATRAVRAFQGQGNSP